jgi:hypothetical protein
MEWDRHQETVSVPMTGSAFAATTTGAAGAVMVKRLTPGVALIA